MPLAVVWDPHHSCAPPDHQTQDLGVLPTPPHDLLVPAANARASREQAASPGGAAGTATAGLQNQQPKQNPSGKDEEGKGIRFCLARPRSNSGEGCQPASQPLQLPCVCLPAASR